MINSKFSVVKTFTRKDSKHWKDIFKKYTKCTDQFIKTFKNQYEYTDAPYWNIERSNVGMFATACWLNDWVALEEYTADKIDEDTTVTGRCDLWLSSKKGKKNYAIEAKKGYCSLDSKDITKNLNKILNLAFEDAEKLDEEGDKHMGVAFMHFYLRKDKINKGKDLSIKAVKQIKDYFKNKENSDLEFAYIYLKDNGVQSDKSIIPGVVVVGKVVTDNN